MEPRLTLDEPPAYEEVTRGDAAPLTQDAGPSTSAMPAAGPTFVPPQHGQSSKPDGKASLPSYDASTYLPTYKEAQKEKEEEARREIVDAMFHLSDDEDEVFVDGMHIGNDCYFMLAFLVGFFFNWFGLFIGYIIIYNWGGRYGSISGFGLSSMKWLFFIRFSDCCENYFINSHEVIWWLCSALAFLIFMKGIISWMRMRRLAMPRPIE